MMYSGREARSRVPPLDALEARSGGPIDAVEVGGPQAQLPGKIHVRRHVVDEQVQLEQSVSSERITQIGGAGVERAARLCRPVRRVP